MSYDHRYTHSALPTPQSSPKYYPEETYKDYTAAKQRATSAIWSVLENSDTNDEPQTPVLFGERHVKALVSLSGSLLSMLSQFGDSPLCKQSIFDLTKFVLDVMDTSVDREKAKDLAQFIFEFIQESTPASGSPIVEDEAALITSEEDMEDMEGMTGSWTEEVERREIHLAVSEDRQVSRRVRSPPPLDYDHAPIAQSGARLLSDWFGLDSCPRTVSNYSPTLSEYISDVIFTAGIERSIAIHAFALLSRLNEKTGVNVPYGRFGLFITAYMVASKVLRDRSYNNASWYTIGQKMFTLAELNEMERKMCENLEWQLGVDMRKFGVIELELSERYEAEVNHVGTRLPTPIPSPLTIVPEQVPTLPPCTSLLALSPSFRNRPDCFAFVHLSPVSESFAYAEMDISPRWTPPSPSTLGSTFSYQAGMRNNNNSWRPMWAEHNAVPYNDLGCGSNEDGEDEDEVF